MAARPEREVQALLKGHRLWEGPYSCPDGGIVPLHHFDTKMSGTGPPSHKIVHLDQPATYHSSGKIITNLLRRTKFAKFPFLHSNPPYLSILQLNLLLVACILAVWKPAPSTTNAIIKTTLHFLRQTTQTTTTNNCNKSATNNYNKQLPQTTSTRRSTQDRELYCSR